ncbi:MAG: serine/threonine protein kinase [Acidobacteria bacterium]|nr:serine/threonine protein kinase [Acidobacteriota bacterium]
MTPARWRQIQDLYHAASQIDAADRATFLESACGSDQELRAEVQSLLEAGEQSGGVFQSSIERMAAAVIAGGGIPKSGQQIGSYRLIQELGRGGMGTVYLAERADQQYEARVALKIVKRGTDTDEVLRRFRYERQILAHLEHPNIARLLDGGTTQDGLPYLVMEYVKGEPIGEYCDRCQLTINERLQLFRTVCAAVQYAHQNLVVHRDLKPSNIMVTLEGTPKLLDFGIAKVLHPEPEARAGTGTALEFRRLTPDYASPEQIRCENVTTASDVYSLGVCLYELLTGHRPYHLRQAAPKEIERVILGAEPPKPSATIDREDGVREVAGSGAASGRAGDFGGPVGKGKIAGRCGTSSEGLRKSLAGDLDNIVLMAIRREPQRRYGSVEQFSEDIRRHLAGLPVIARQDTFGYRAGKFLKRHRAGVVVAACVMVLVIGSAMMLTLQSARIARERDRAILAERWAGVQRAEADRARDAERAGRELAEASLLRAESAERKASGEAERATREAARARTEAKTAKRTSDFIVGLFQVADPGRTRGQTITAREILDHGRSRIAEDLEQEPAVQATLMDTMGRVYENLGMYDSAKPLLEQALKLRRESRSVGDAERAHSMNNLAEVLRRRGDYAAAESLYRDALSLRRKSLGKAHPEVAESMDNLALVLVHQGQYQPAETLFRESLAMRRRMLGSDHEKVAESLNNLGDLLRQTGRLDAAESMLREALALRRRQFGEHPKVAIILDNLAIVLHSRGDLDAAEALYRESLAMFRRILGERHPDVATNLNNLAALLFAKGDYAGAEPVYRQALSLFEEQLGPEHPSVANVISNLALVRHRKGDLAASEAMFRQSLAIRRRKLPEGHLDLTYSLTGLGQCLIDQKSPEEAEAILREALEIRRKALPPGDWRIAEAQSLLGSCLLSLHRYGEAEPLLLEGYTLLRDKLGAENRRTRAAHSRLMELPGRGENPE